MRGMNDLDKRAGLKLVAVSQGFHYILAVEVQTDLCAFTLTTQPGLNGSVPMRNDALACTESSIEKMHCSLVVFQFMFSGQSSRKASCYPYSTILTGS